MRTDQFILKKFKYEEDKLYIEIEEKWSIFPVPLITQSGNYYNRGILLYENNFLGKLGTIAPAVSWTNSGINGLLYYQNDTQFSPESGIKVLLMHNAQLTEFDRKKNVVFSYETRLDSIIVTPNYSVGRHENKLGPIYTKKKIIAATGDTLFESTSYGLFYRHHYNLYRKLPILFDGLVTTYDLYLQEQSDGKITLLHGGDIQYSRPTGNDFINARAHAYQSNRSGFESPEMLGGLEGHRGYDKESLPVQYNVGFMLQYQKEFIKRTYIAPFYEFNFSKLIRTVSKGEKLKESTVGVSLKYYFKKLSIPGVILEYARNIDDESHHFHFNVGLSL